MPPPRDVETVLVGQLVTDGVLNGNISTRLPRDFTGELPYGTLHRAPGSRFIDGFTHSLEAVRLQLNTIADIGDDEGAFAAMAEFLEALAGYEATGIGELFFPNVDLGSPQWSPDPESERPGYLAFVVVFAKAYEHVV